MITDQYQYHEPLGNGKVLEKDFRPPGKIEDVKEEEPGWNNFRLRVMHEEVQGAQGGELDPRHRLRWDRPLQGLI